MYNILRENDIRGKYPEEINEKVALRVGLAFGTYLNNKGVNNCLVGYDNRLSSKSLFENVIEGLLKTGINITSINLSTTALFNFSARELKKEFGIMITASHNHHYDNGFKVFGDKYLHLNKTELNKFYEIYKNENYSLKNQGTLEYENKTKEYVDMLINTSDINRDIKLMIDTGNGTPSVFIKDIFDNMNLKEVMYLNDVSDGSFPVHNPDPNDPENLVELGNKIKEYNFDLGLAFDGDGDRVGLVNENGEMVATDIFMAIMSEEIIQNNDNKKIILDVKCSKALKEEIKRLGGEPLMLKNGSAYIETMMNEKDALFGGEYSGHVFFRDDFPGYDDGIYAGVRFLNLFSKKQKTVSQLYDHLTKYHNTPEIRIKSTDSKKWEVVESIKKYAKSNYNDIITIDGVRIEHKDGFSLIRASNTSPYITLRFESKDKDTLSIREKEFTNLVNYFNQL